MLLEESATVPRQPALLSVWLLITLKLLWSFRASTMHRCDCSLVPMCFVFPPQLLWTAPLTSVLRRGTSRPAAVWVFRSWQLRSRQCSASAVLIRVYMSLLHCGQENKHYPEVRKWTMSLWSHSTCIYTTRLLFWLLLPTLYCRCILKTLNI